MVKELLTAGLTDDQAEAVTLNVRITPGISIMDFAAFATKADLQAVQADLKSAFAGKAMRLPHTANARRRALDRHAAKRRLAMTRATESQILRRLVVPAKR